MQPDYLMAQRRHKKRPGIAGAFALAQEGFA
jgi:hypothetical protein